jgi:acetylornithine deacetylase
VLDRLRADVEANFAAKVAFLQEIVCFLSKRGQEVPLQDWIARDMAAHGYAMERFAITGTPLAAHAKAAPMIEAHAAASVQVMATHRAASPTGRSPIPQGHIGLVPEGPAEDVDPPAICRRSARQLAVRSWHQCYESRRRRHDLGEAGTVHRRA